ncbi:MAG: helix-turn-helix domain-containing protein [Cyclobacteriaceae bacterium]
MSYLLAIGLTFNFIYLLSFLKQPRFRTEIFLTAALLLITTLEIANALLFTSGLIYKFPHLLRINTPFLFLLAPATWLLIRTKISKSSLSVIELFHLIPFLISFIYLLPLYVSPTDEKIVYINQLVQGTLRDSYILGGARRIQQAIYLIIISRVFCVTKNIYSIKQSRFILFIYLVLVLTWLISVFRYIFWFNFSGGLIEVGLLCLMSILLVYYKLSDEGDEWKGDRGATKYRTSGLSNEIRQKYVRQIDNALVEKKLFADQEITLSSFAERLAIPAHHLSQVFGQDMGTNFKELINRHRVEEAKALLVLEENRLVKIEVIAFRAGFKSISTFNTSFKKITGLRPKDYRAKLSNQKKGTIRM